MVMNENTDDSVAELWGEGVVRVFISHTSEHKEKAANLKIWLSQYGMASFVAHEDIEPMKEWQIELERALRTMGMFVALLTEGFSQSDWTDQEVGCAVAAKVPIFPIRMGRNPYGFIEKYQAFPTGDFNSSIAVSVLRFALKDEKLKAEATDALIFALRSSSNFDASNHLAPHLKSIHELTDSQEQALVDAFNENSQVSNAWRITESIVAELKRLTGHDYEIDGNQLQLLLTW